MDERCHFIAPEAQKLLVIGGDGGQNRKIAKRRDRMTTALDL
jgi:hypothetical protein